MWLGVTAALWRAAACALALAASEGSPALYQFRHLSFQEALFARKCCEKPSLIWASEKQAIQTLKDPFLFNTLKIGGGVRDPAPWG